jgi:hypothetical protein
MVTMGILPYQGKNPHGRAGNRTRDRMSSQKRWPLDHEAGQLAKQIAVRWITADVKHALILSTSYGLQTSHILTNN